MFYLLKKTNKICLLVIVLLLFSNAYFVLMHSKYESLYNWHHLKYHELNKLMSYRETYPIGTLMSDVIDQEVDYQKDHAWCENDNNKLCVEPKLSDWQYSHYCGFTFNFESNRLVEIHSNSPCH